MNCLQIEESKPNDTSDSEVVFVNKDSIPLHTKSKNSSGLWLNWVSYLNCKNAFSPVNLTLLSVEMVVWLTVRSKSVLVYV